MHTAQAALDDNPGTYWSLGRNDSVAATIIGKKFETQHNPKAEVWQKSGWLEVDLGTKSKVTRAVIRERFGWDYSQLNAFSIAYESNGQWLNVVDGTTIGDEPLEVVFPEPVSGRKFRLSIEADGRPAISEFQLFADN